MTYNEACWLLERYEDSKMDPTLTDDMLYRARLTKGLHESEIKEPKD